MMGLFARAEAPSYALYRARVSAAGASWAVQEGRVYRFTAGEVPTVLRQFLDPFLSSDVPTDAIVIDIDQFHQNAARVDAREARSRPKQGRYTLADLQKAYGWTDAALESAKLLGLGALTHQTLEDSYWRNSPRYVSYVLSSDLDRWLDALRAVATERALKG